MGDNFGGQVAGPSRTSPQPVSFSNRYRGWGMCDNEDSDQMKLLSTSEIAERLTIHHSTTSLRMVPTMSRKDADFEKMLIKGFDDWNKKLLAQRRANDLKAGKKNNESDYKDTSNRYKTKAFGLYLYTSLWQKGAFGTQHTLSRDRSYDCHLKTWTNYEGKKNITITTSEKLEENTNEDGFIFYTKHSGIDIQQFEEFTKNPKQGGTFTSGFFQFSKDQSSETETRTIITLIIHPSHI